MATDLTGSYSGIVLNQNATYTNTYDWATASNGNWLFQTFTFPSDYTRGVGDQARIPDLSGFQVLANIEMEGVLNYRVDYYMDNSEGWLPITAGTTDVLPVGLTWVDVTFPTSAPISIIQLARQCRFGIQLVGNIGMASVPYVSPTPLLHPATGQGQVYGADGITPIHAPNACLNFRLLALVGDSGTNFLGNQYRSCIIQASPGNVNTTDGATPVPGSGDGTYWLSPPQPSRFAVQSLYFDVRPVPLLPSFGTINYVGNPSFEYDGVGLAPLWWNPVSGIVGS